MNDEVGNKILEKLNTLIKLTALETLENKEVQEQVRTLSAIGLQPKEIAEILGKTSNSVRVMLSYVRSKNRKIETRKGSESEQR